MVASLSICVSMCSSSHDEEECDLQQSFSTLPVSFAEVSVLLYSVSDHCNLRIILWH